MGARKLVLVALGAAALVTAAQAGPSSLRRVPDLEAFRSIAVVSEGSLYAKFLVDRGDDRIDFIDTRKHRFHYDFARTRYPNLSLEAFNDVTYTAPNRRFIAGTLAYHSTHDAYTMEFWEGDTINRVLMGYLRGKLERFFTAGEVAFKPNSPIHEELAKTLAEDGVRILTADEIFEALPYKVYNTGRTVGRLRFLDPEEDPDEVDYDPQDVVVLHTMPSDITPVRGIIATRFSTPLSHVNLRAYAWKIPNMVLKEAVREFSRLDGEMVVFTCNTQGYEVREATPKEVADFEASRPKPAPVHLTADLSYRGMPELGRLGADGADRVGTKAANLSELARDPRLRVPRGFSVPFAWYKDFLEANQLDRRIRETLEDPRLPLDPAHRRKALQRLREDIRAGRHTEEFRRAFRKQLRENFPDAAFFVRSSTNAEDLPGFNGAGLYDTVPNVRGEEALLEAVKKVWASVFNYKAHQERAYYGLVHETVYPAVLLLETVEANCAGVLITTDIYNAQFPDSFTINAKRGLGVSVVDGKSVPEQVIYEPHLDSIKILSRSVDETEIVIGPDGELIEKPVEGKKPVLSESDVRAIGRAAERVRRVFRREGVQDVEWAIDVDAAGERRVWILQSRPYLGGGTASDNAKRGALVPGPIVQPVGITLGPPPGSWLR